MDLKTHEEFCAELERRKTSLIKRNRTKRRILSACIPLVFCLGILAGTISRAGVELDTNKPLEGITGAMKLEIALPHYEMQESASANPISFEIRNTEGADKILTFITSYEDQLLFSDGNGWYVHRSGSPEQAENETCFENETCYSTQATEIKWQTGGALNEGTGDSDFESAEHVHEMTDIIASDEEQRSSTSIVENLSPPALLIPDSEKDYFFSGARLDQCVESVDQVYVITIHINDGKTVQYALDVVKYGDLAQELALLLTSIEN